MILHAAAPLHRPSVSQPSQHFGETAHVCSGLHLARDFFSCCDGQQQTLRGGWWGGGGRDRSKSGAKTARASASQHDRERGSDVRKGVFGSAGLLALLLCIYTHNQLTRSSLIYAVNFATSKAGEAAEREFMNVALSFSPTQYGLLASYGFTVLYALMSLVAGRSADTHDRVKTLASAALVWSLALGLQGSPWSSFPLVWVCRIAQGVAMAFTGPQAISLLADAFPGPRLAFATSVYSTGVYLGGSLASLSMIANARLGWRSTFMGVGAVGASLAVALAAFIRDEKHEARAPKSATGKPEAGGSLRAVGDVLKCRGIPWLLAATAVRFCAGYGIGIWAAPFYRAKFPSMQSSFAVINALTIGVGGCVSTVIGGIIAERLAGSDNRAVTATSRH